MIKIVVADTPPSLNEINNMNRTHYWEYQKAKKDWDTEVGWLAKLAKNKRGGTITKPVRIVIKYYFRTNRRRDPDNYTAAAKFLMDGLVDGGLLEGDSFKEIESLKVEQPEVSKKDPRTEIIIME